MSSELSEFQDIKQDLFSMRLSTFSGLLFFLFINLFVLCVGLGFMAVATDMPQENSYLWAKIATVVVWVIAMVAYVILRRQYRTQPLS